MFNTNEKKKDIYFFKNNFSSNEAIIFFFWVAAILVGRSERVNKQNFILVPVLLLFDYSKKYSANYCIDMIMYMAYGIRRHEGQFRFGESMSIVD
jgi:hypothetical protein